MNCRKIIIGLLASTAVTAGAAQAATQAGTSVSNTATVNFSTGSIAQPPVTTTPATFVVDRRVSLTVTEDGSSSTEVVPNQQKAVATFIVSNETNGTQDFLLTAAQTATGGKTKRSGAADDSFNGLNFLVYADNDGDNVFDPTKDTQDWVDNLAAGTTRKVFVVMDIPDGTVVSDQQFAGVTLVAAVADGSGALGTKGAALTATTTADDKDQVDVVFAEAAPAVPADAVAGDIARDGRASNRDDFKVVAASVQLVKSSIVISDPENSTTNPKRIPGAVVEYCIVAKNTGNRNATGLSLTDSLNAAITAQRFDYVDNSLVVGTAVGTGDTCTTGGTTEDNDTSGADDTDSMRGSFASNTVTVGLDTLAASTSLGIKFRVTLK